MSSPAKAHEPSMEEILASIRRIISDDEPAPAKTPPRGALRAAPEPLPEPLPAPGTGAADLGQDDIDAMFAAMDSAAPAAAPETKPDLTRPPPEAPGPVEFADDLDVLELTDEVTPDEPPATPAPVRSPPPQQANARPAGRLLSSEATQSVSNAFETLAGTVLAGNARTLDDIVSEMLRPMLRAWLDDNLPPLVERLVRQEIERVARGGR